MEMPPLIIVYLLSLIRRGNSLSQVLGEGQPQLKGVKVINDCLQGSFVSSHFYFLIKEIKATNFPLSISLPITHRCWCYVLTVFHFWIACHFIFQISFIIQEWVRRIYFEFQCTFFLFSYGLLVLFTYEQRMQPVWLCLFPFSLFPF